jgi:tricorn protease
MSDAISPVFDKEGKYLYFMASTDAGPTRGFIDMSGIFDRPVTRSLYLIVLRNDLPSPLAPESDEEKVDEPGSSKEASSEEKTPADGEKTEEKDGEKKAEEKKKEPVTVRIDL